MEMIAVTMDEQISGKRQAARIRYATKKIAEEVDSSVAAKSV
jgi:hypothetical protein